MIVGRTCLAVLLAVACLPAAQAQVAPLQYWSPGGPFGVGAEVTNADAQGWLNGLGTTDEDGVRRGFSFRSYSAPVSAFSSGLSWAGIGAFGSRGLALDGSQVGYGFRGIGDMPVTLFGGVQTLRTTPDAFTALTMPGFTSGQSLSTAVHAGVEFRPTSNISLSLSAGYVQQNSGVVDSDIRSQLLPGETPMFSGVRR